ncbi:hypothetical protein E8D34_16965 [Nocardioides sp. GY 10113]|uniref:hypothetical protein n=1 Tax=Nocardioides sp. GY 10113 TaxID=2569761 RepID=UPI0010A75820|nr:hypothetical protein [Nocardioides sp. GY 10113]TIC82508.1 hypothetical protein E8D34_16965 [Nocardioides sp. GY 10113]
MGSGGSTGKRKATSYQNDGDGRRRGGLIWFAAAGAAVVLALGVSGTLSSWTEAVIGNDTNSVTTGGAVALKQTRSSDLSSCDTLGSADNSVLACTLQPYGGDAATLLAGDSHAEEIHFVNDGTADGTLTLDMATCVDTSPSTHDLCDVTEVTISCDGDGGVSLGPATLTSLNGTSVEVESSLTKASGKDVQCDVSVALPGNAPAALAGLTATQGLTWTLSA